jgi:hypothetical protein
MNIKFAIFILIASILTMAMYSSSVNFVSAMSYIWKCLQDSGDGTSASCTNTDTKGVKTNYNCTYDTTTKKWSCVKAKTSSGTPNQMPGFETLNKMTDSQIPLGLKGALQSMVQNGNLGSQMRQNNTQNSTSYDMRINNSPPPTNPTGPGKIGGLNE